MASVTWICEEALLRKKLALICIFLTSFAILTREACVTQTTVSFCCKTSLTGCFIIARGTGARILIRRGNGKRCITHNKSRVQNQKIKIHILRYCGWNENGKKYHQSLSYSLRQIYTVKKGFLETFEWNFV